MNNAFSMSASKAIQRRFVVMYQRIGKTAEKRYPFQVFKILPVHPHI